MMTEGLTEVGKAKIDEVLDGIDSASERRRRAATASLIPGGEVRAG